MNRKQRLASQSVGRKMMKLPFDEFKNITDYANNKHKILNPNSNHQPDKTYQNNHYSVQLFFNYERKGKFYTKAMIRRNDGKPLTSWNDLFRIKNEIFGEEKEAIQFLPPKSELIDVANLYWIYIENE